MQNKITVGTTNYARMTYDSLLENREKELQIVHWPNGEGFSIIKEEGTMIELDWDEWIAIRKLVSAADKLKNNPLV